MTHQLNFELIYQYDPGHSGIALPVSLGLGAETIITEAHLDTGAANCFFRRSLGEKLGLDIDSGHFQRFSSPGGGVEGYGHFITLEVLGLEIETMVYFAKDHGFNRNLLGRHGWLQRVKIGVVDYEGILYLSSYESDPSS